MLNLRYNVQVYYNVQHVDAQLVTVPNTSAKQTTAAPDNGVNESHSLASLPTLQPTTDARRPTTDDRRPTANRHIRHLVTMECIVQFGYVLQ